MGFAASMVRAIVASGFTWLALWALARGGAYGMEAATAAMPDASMFARYRAGFWPATGPWLLVAAMPPSSRIAEVTVTVTGFSG